MAVARKLAAMVLCASALVVPAVAATPASASASGSVGILGNQCGLRTSAYPNSYFERSFSASQCGICLSTAVNYSNKYQSYYCTYNPSNDKVDLHYRWR
ncbi:hypothetical protein GCM10018952_62990 [Streptosporangium vulgare]